MLYIRHTAKNGFPDVKGRTLIEALYVTIGGTLSEERSFSATFPKTYDSKF